MKNHNGQEDGMKGFVIEDGAVFVAETPHEVFNGAFRKVQITVEAVKVTVMKGLDGNVSHRVFVTYFIEEDIIETNGDVFSHFDNRVENKPVDVVVQAITTRYDCRQVR